MNTPFHKFDLNNDECPAIVNHRLFKQNFQQNQDYHQDIEIIIPRRSSARSINKEVMMYRERLAAQMSSAKKQTVLSSKNGSKHYYHNNSENESSDELFALSENEGSVIDSVFSTPASSPRVLNARTNHSPPREFYTRSTPRSLIPSMMQNDDVFDEEFLEEICEASVCEIDTVILVKSVHSVADRKRPLLFIRINH